MTLTGHDEAWAEWRAAMASDRMHHAWILAGKRGIGKGAFARAAARALVAEAGMAQPDMHPDIIVLDHLPSNDTEEAKRADGKPFTLKRNITIDQIRRMQQRLNTRPTLGSRRVIIIDPADDLEKGAVNALLKSLEEPPVGSFFLLVAHRPGRLLPTIRSRCRMLRFEPLADSEVNAILAREAPEADAATRRRGALAQEIGGKPDRDRIQATLDLARAVLAEDLAAVPRGRQARIIEAHGAIVALAAQAPTYNFDAGLLVMEIGCLLASAAMPRETAS
jgi:DNA polymerase-3 subunit delta'